MIEITFDSTVTGLKALVEEEGADFVYAKREGVCVYDGKPDCIVGRFLAAQGVPLERLKEADTGSFGSGLAAHSLMRDLGDEGVISYDGSARSLLSEVQHNQDQGLPWGVALSEALAYLN